MAIDWQRAYLNAYAVEAQRALQRFLAGERDPQFLSHALQLIRTYVHIPARHSESTPDPSVIAQLAGAIQSHLSAHGYVNDIIALWPTLITISARQGTPALYAELVKQLALAHSLRGNNEQTCQLYLDLVREPIFPELPLRLQADVLLQLGTTFVWQGQLGVARELLQEVLALTTLHSEPAAQRNLVDQYGIRGSFVETPLWESEAYALNQLGNIAMFRGEFVRAEQLYLRCWAVLNQHGEAENLACVAHQAMGRLYLYWHRPQAAISLLERGLVIRRRRQDREGTLTNQLYLAAALLQVKEFSHAEALLTMVLPAMKKDGTRRDVGLCHIYLGEIACRLGQRTTFHDHWRQALACLATVHTPLIEQGPLLKQCTSLWMAGERRLFQCMVRQLWRSAREQELTPYDLGRLCLRLWRRSSPSPHPFP